MTDWATRSIEDLGLSVRSRNALYAAGIKIVSDVADNSAADLERIPGMGRKCADEVARAVANVGLPLRGTR